MPKRITPQQLAASASVGEVRTKASFDRRHLGCVAHVPGGGAHSCKARHCLRLETVSAQSGGRRRGGSEGRSKSSARRTQTAWPVATLVTDENDAGQLHERLKVTVSALLDR